MIKHKDYVANSRFTDVFPETSGNEINGLGETIERRPSPFFWHPPDRQTHGALQSEVIAYHRQSPEIRKHFSPDPPGGRGPKPVEQARERLKKPAANWTAAVKAFALANESDLVGITAVDPSYVYQGYEVAEPWVIVIGVAMDHSELNQAPPSFENPVAGVVVAKEYNRAARACRKLANYILENGYYAKAYQGPYASALNMIPTALAAGFGELGKHGSIINDTYGSSFRLSAVTTDMPLISDQPADIGAEDFCLNCHVCTNACPPDAIFENKQMVRGVRKWYVDFDKCIPYFGETLGCGICIARCPWSFPDTAGKLSRRMLARRSRKANASSGPKG
jgi:epoxyqueuosine reductase